MKRKIIGFDTETYLKNKQHTYFLAQFYSEDFDPPLSRIFEIYKEEELDSLVTFLKSRQVRGNVLVGFNISFDLAVLAKAVANHNFKIKLFDSGRVIYGILTHNKHNIYVIDLKNLTMARSLYELSRYLSIEKRKPVYLGTEKSFELYLTNEQYREVMRQYAITDAKICYLGMKKLLESFKAVEEFNNVLRFTASSNAVSMFMRNLGFRFPKYPDEVEAKLRRSYRGGRVEVFKRGTNTEKVHLYDINSLYPYCMKNYRYPLISTESTFRFVKKQDVDLEFEGVAKVAVKIDSKYPVLGVKKECPDGFERLIFPEGYIVDWFTYPELRAVEDMGIGKITKVFESFEYKVWCRPFEEFIDKLYSLRKNYKDDKFKNKFFKLLMNSLYGKFGEYRTGKLIELVDGETVKQLNKVENRHRYYSNVVWASYITAYARLTLYNYIVKAKPETVYYCDTDSIVTSTTMETGDELGMLKEEGVAKPYEATFIRSKFYIFGSTIRLRGFAISIDAEDFRRLLISGAKYIDQERILSIKEALRRKKPMLLHETYRKMLNVSEDFKRVYERYLSRKDLFETHVDSDPRVVMDGNTQ